MNKSATRGTATLLLMAIGLSFSLLWVSLRVADPEPFDDAFIAFRYAENAVAGQGLVFNHGERVEGFSSPLFMGILMLAGWLGLSFAGSAMVVNTVALAVVLFLSARWIDELVVSDPPVGVQSGKFAGLPIPWAAIALAWAFLLLHPTTQLYLTSGLETWVYGALLVGYAFVARRPVTGSRALLLGTLATVLALARPEGLALVPLSIVIVLYDVVARNRGASGVRGASGDRGATDSDQQRRQKSGPPLQTPAASLWPSLALCAVVPLVVLGGLLAARLSYYGLPLPNTYYAKIGSSDVLRFTRGSEYVLRETPWLVLPPILFVLLSKPALRSWLSLMGLWSFAVAFSVYSGGDWMPGSRFLVPALLAVTIMVGWIGAWSLALAKAHLTLRFGWVRLAALVGLLVLLVGFGLQSQLQTVRLQQREADWIKTFGAVARQIQSEDPDALVATGGIGIIAFDGDLEVLDVFGLTEPAIAEGGKWASRGTAGHQSYDGDYVWFRRPNVLLPHSIVTSGPLDRDQFVATILSPPEPNRFWMSELLDKPEFENSYEYRVFGLDGDRYVGAFQSKIP